MALLDRFFGGGRDRAHAEGIEHLEAGRFGEAVACLREAASGRGEVAKSIASYHFRQALVAEGRRLLRGGESAAARRHFAEAVAYWDVYPDLHCLLGVADAVSGAWEAALGGARAALRINADYIEARLLEAVCLEGLGRDREAAASLDALLESGRRVEHWLHGRLARAGGYGAGDLPEGLLDLLVGAVGGESEKEEVAAAVALCRAGRWEDGLERFADLVERRPRYPDYRTRHAAVLFQLGRNEEALAEVDAALALNETYKAARDLKALVLADCGRVMAARRVLEARDPVADREGNPAHAHEELFDAYLRAVLALLTGEPEMVREQLDRWPDLPRNFARAELLLAAAEDLTGREDSCGRRLGVLAAEWKAEPVYAWLLACHHLRQRRYDDLAGVLAHWPAAGGREDWRPLLLEGHLAVCQGRVPALPEEADLEPATGPGVHGDGPVLARPAWEHLRARAAFLQGDDAACWALCEGLAATGPTERIVRLQTAAAAALPDAGGGWSPPEVLPDSCLPGAVQLLARRDDADAAAACLAGPISIHPEDPVVCWLSPRFWLEPVRGWIA